MFDALEGAEFFGDILQPADLAFQEHNFEAVVVIDMNMRRCDNGMMMLVLEASKFFFQIPLVMIIYEGKHPKTICCRRPDVFLNEP